MSLDRITQAAYFAEIGPRLIGRRIEKVRPHGKSALRMELSSRDVLFVDVSRSFAGLWLISRASAVPPDARDVEGPSRNAALLFKKHLEGARVDGLEASPSRTLTLTTSRALLVLRSHGVSAVTLVMDGEGVAHFGGGELVLPGLPEAAPTVGSDPDRLVREVSSAHRDSRRSLLAERDPGLLPLLRRWPDNEGAIENLAALLGGALRPRPFLSPRPGDDATNATRAPMILPFDPADSSPPASSFDEAAEQLYVASRRADLFRERLQARTARARSEVARLSRLKTALDRDRGRWPDPVALRLKAEALLASPPREEHLPKGRDAVTITVPDPHGEGLLEIAVHPSMSLPQNANAMFARARSIEKQRTAFAERWSSVITLLDTAESALTSFLSVRSLDELDADAAEAGSGKTTASPSRYLTSRGLEMLFGRNASENHDVTFKVAKREDIWFHVLDAPGGHVVLRNREGRANRDDIAEAASLAAFLSERRTESNVDVQYTERKHVHPAGGGKGRVRVSHAEVIRVAPKDPAGRLRAR